MKKINRLPAATPADSDAFQRHLFSDPILAAANAITRYGSWHRYLPKKPEWCRTIGDEIFAKTIKGEPITPSDIERMMYAKDAARSRLNMLAMKRKPKPGQALILHLVRYLDGSTLWRVKVVSLDHALRLQTVGTA